MNKTKIIVVEDNIVYCEYVCNMLSREGYRNMKAYHLSTAKKHLQQATDNDIVVADLRLPDGSGIDLLCWMRKEGKMQPFIIMTDYAEVNTAVESMKLGSIDYIPKQLVEDKLAVFDFFVFNADSRAEGVEFQTILSASRLSDIFFMRLSVASVVFVSGA